MITAIIIDDEQKNVSTLVTMLSRYCSNVCLTGTASNITAGKALIDNLRPDVVFLDIEMPYGSGFDLLRSFSRVDFEIIFVTAYDQFALEAFRYAALDYLLKPVNIDLLERAVRRAESRIIEKATKANYDLLLHNLAEKDITKKSIAITDKGIQHFICLSDIRYLIADGSYTHIHTVSKVFVVAKSLKEFEELLPGTAFFRIHHGHMINRVFLTKIEKGRGGTAVMKDGRRLEISVRRKDDFLKMLQG